MTSSIFPLLSHEQHLMLIEDLARFERECKAEGARRASLPSEPRIPGAEPETVYISLAPPMQWPSLSPPGPTRTSSLASISSTSTSTSASSSTSQELTPEERRERNLQRFKELEKEVMRKQAKREHIYAVKRRSIIRPGSATHDHAYASGRRGSQGQLTLPPKQWY